MPDDGRNSAPVPGKAKDELRLRFVCVHTGHALDSAPESLHKHRSVRTQTRFFGLHLGVAVFTHVEVGCLEQSEIAETPHLISHAAKNILQVHRRVCGHDAIQFRQHDQAVGREQGIGKCSARVLLEQSLCRVVDSTKPPGSRPISPVMSWCSCWNEAGTWPFDSRKRNVDAYEPPYP